MCPVPITAFTLTSQFSIELAKEINGEIVNADSMQVYKALDQITNKHPLNERENVPHHVMNHVNWDEDYFIHRFNQEASQAIADIHSRGKVPIIIGGTHYYLQNLLFSNKTLGEREYSTENEPIPARALTESETQLLDGPVEDIFKEVSRMDPTIAEKFHPQDKRKLRRALEIYLTTGKRPSDIYLEQKLDELEDSSLKYNTLLFWVYSDSEILSERLDKRVDKMIENGALEEIKEMDEFLRKQDPPPDLTKGIWQVIGFKEFLPWLDLKQENTKLFEEGVERMKIRTRQYAKYQVKWIRKLLAMELQKESRFNFKYGGKLYLLNASDLSKWQENVSSIGLSIAKQFLAGGSSSVKHAQVPEELESKNVFPTEDYLSNFNSNKKLGSETNWKHYECPVCKDKAGKPFIAVGEDSWKVHETSRRHKKQLQYNDRKRKHEDMVAHYKKMKEVSQKEEPTSKITGTPPASSG